MKLLEAIDKIDVNDKEILKNILYSLQERREKIIQSEPYSYGSAYTKWEEKLSDLEDIVEDLELFENTRNKKEKQKLLNRIKVNLRVHQFTYGGLKRLTI